MYDAEEGDWMEPMFTTFQYDNRGNVICAETDDGYTITRVVSTYDDNNQVIFTETTVMEDGEWMPESRRTYVYDPVLTSYYTERKGYSWNGAEWEENYFNETNAITRDEKGNITEIVKSLPFGGAMVPAYKSVWTYDAESGKPVAFEYFTNTFGESTPEWELYNSTSYRNMTWAFTDGQITVSSPTELVEGVNRLLSCEVYYDGEPDGHIVVEYDETNPGDYTLSETFADITQIGRSEKRETIDANGSTRVTVSEYFDEEGNPTEEPTYQMIHTTTLDEHGNIVAEDMYEAYADEEPMLMDASQVEYAYDENGNPQEVVYSFYDVDLEEYIPDSRTVYGSYLDATGVGSVAAAVKNAAAPVYNLQGVMVAPAATEEALRSLPAGLYITSGRKISVK